MDIVKKGKTKVEIEETQRHKEKGDNYWVIRDILERQQETCHGSRNEDDLKFFHDSRFRYGWLSIKVQKSILKSVTYCYQIY